MLIGMFKGLIYLFLALTALPLSAWEPVSYERLSVTDFFSLPEVNQRIDFTHPDLDLLDAAVFYQTNKVRASQGLPQLGHSSALEKAAFGHARQMVEMNFFSHESPEKRTRTLSDRLSLQGIDLGYKAENIARGFGLEYESGRAVFPPVKTRAGFRYTLEGPDIQPRTYLELAQALVDQWMESPDHRANLLNPQLKFLGCGVFTYKATQFYNMDYVMAVQDFSSVAGP